MNIIINGISGRMGINVLKAAQKSDDIKHIAGIDKNIASLSFQPVYKSFDDIDLSVKYDCIIDFSVKEAIYEMLPFAIKNNIAVVLATTGFDDKDLEYIINASKKIPIFKSGNMSIGINAMIALVEHATKLLGDKADIEIIEQHHNNKIDAPSGTALMLANAVSSNINDDMNYTYGREGIVGTRMKNEIGIHSVRGGTIVGKHEVLFVLNNEIISLKHEAEDRAIFANGSIEAAKFLIGKKPKIYDMKDMIF